MEVNNALLCGYLLCMCFCYYSYFTGNKGRFCMSFMLFIFYQFCTQKLYELSGHRLHVFSAPVFVVSYSLWKTQVPALILRTLIQYVLPFHMFFYMTSQAIFDV